MFHLTVCWIVQFWFNWPYVMQWALIHSHFPVTSILDPLSLKHFPVLFKPLKISQHDQHNIMAHLEWQISLRFFGERLFTHHRSIYTGLSFSHNPSCSTCLWSLMLNGTHSGLAVSYGSPFPKLNIPALPGFPVTYWAASQLMWAMWL